MLLDDQVLSLVRQNGLRNVLQAMIRACATLADQPPKETLLPPLERERQAVWNYQHNRLSQADRELELIETMSRTTQQFLRKR